MDMVFKFSVYTRLLAAARRIARAAESIAQSQATIARCTLSDWEKANVKPAARHTEFSTLDLKEVNKEYHKQRVEAGLEDPE